MVQSYAHAGPVVNNVNNDREIMTKGKYIHGVQTLCSFIVSCLTVSQRPNSVNVALPF